MRHYFKQLLRSLQGIHSALVQTGTLLVAAMEPRPLDGNLEGRISALEASREVFEGNMEGRWLKIDARFNAARSAEERTRRLEAPAGFPDDGDEAGQEEFKAAYLSYLQDVDAQGSSENGMSPMQEVLAGPRSSRDEVKARKWARV